MNIFKIAWRSIQHRGLGSLLAILSMALGVMLVVSVLSIHGLVSESFKSNSSFGYNILIGARGGSLQLTMNTVYYLSRPVENIPYEFYLAFCDREKRQQEMQKSLAWQALQNELEALSLFQGLHPSAAQLATQMAAATSELVVATQFRRQTRMGQHGMYQPYTDVAIPLCLGDSFEVPGSETYFRCIGTTPEFFEKLVLDVDTEETFQFAAGRAFQTHSPEHGFFECVIGALVAKNSGLKIGDVVYPTHGDPNDNNARIHDEGFTVVGILKGTRTPHDRAVFLNIEGFYLMDDHAKPIAEESGLRILDDDEVVPRTIDPFDDELTGKGSVSNPFTPVSRRANRSISLDDVDPEHDFTTPLPIEQREVTSILVRTANDEFGIYSMFLQQYINDGQLESTLGWSNFRPVQAQKAAQAINPVMEVTKFLETFVGPLQWLLLALTTMICVVSAISILVGIYNSMSQRRHEIAVMRALGASRWKVMSIMFVESMLLATAGGLLGWIGGHLLNVAISPYVETQTGVGIGFFDLAPAEPLFARMQAFSTDWIGIGLLPESLMSVHLSPEVLLIPGLVMLSVLVGIYPSISAYRTDVAKALGK